MINWKTFNAATAIRCTHRSFPLLGIWRASTAKKGIIDAIFVINHSIEKMSCKYINKAILRTFLGGEHYLLFDELINKVDFIFIE